MCIKKISKLTWIYLNKGESMTECIGIDGHSKIQRPPPKNKVPLILVSQQHFCEKLILRRKGIDGFKSVQESSGLLQFLPFQRGRKGL